MTAFEILIISCIYLFCYGYALAMFIEEKYTWLRVAWAIASLAVALYVPLFIGVEISEKLNSERI